ncbi:hypothetical protein Tco_0851422, partial [Tanacetum coccineum]
MPRECLKIIESKSKVRQSRNKAVVAKMSTSSSTPAVSSDVAELKDMVRALILDRKNQTPASAPVKAVEQSCVTCGGGHSYQNCPATNSNMYHDNIQEYVSQAAAANFNQANSGYRPPMVSNQIRPPGFPPVQNPHANSQNNFNRGNNFNQNRGNNFNQGQIYRPPVHQPVVNQPVAHQGPAPQTHGVSKTDFERYVTANDAVLRNMQNQGQNLQSQMANLTDMLSKFVTANTASTSGSGTLPGNTVTNPKEDLKGITTRSGVTIQGPKAVNHDVEVTKDTMPPANNGSTEDVQPPVVQIQTRNPNPEPNVAPVVTPVPKASIPFPSRRNDERKIQNPHANSQNNFNRGNNFNQNRGNNFNQGQIYRPPVHQPVVNQPVAHQGPAPQTHGVSKTDFERYVTANDAVLRNMQNQGQNLQSQMANLTDMLSKFVTANTASTSGSGTLPGNTVTNPKEDLKGITTRSGVTIQGPKAVNHDTEVTKDTMPPAKNGSTKNVQPPVVQIQSRNPNPEPNVAPVVTPVPKASIPFPSRRNDERRKEKANDQIEKFYEIFRDLSFEISFTDALMLMPNKIFVVDFACVKLI